MSVRSMAVNLAVALVLLLSTLLVLISMVISLQCPSAPKYGPGPPPNCPPPTDPNNKPPSDLEKWFTREMFLDLFPWANIGWGDHPCWPYSYQSFQIAARYFPDFGTTSPSNGLTEKENTRRDVAAFFSHSIQETGVNDISVYGGGRSQSEADACFYRGGFYNWFEGGPMSGFLDPQSPGLLPRDGAKCHESGRYCSPSPFYPCGNGTVGGGEFYRSCYFGRGSLQLSYNYNYGQFQDWLATQNISVDLLTNPNLLMTNMNPPLAMLASLWFYMTPQPPKPAMHDIILGNWNPGPVNRAAGYSGPIFGPTSLVINNECSGMDETAPGGGGENRRIRAFIWFCGYFGVPAGDPKLLTCKEMPQRFDQIPQNVSHQPDWSTTWKSQSCDCAPASYGGVVPYFQPSFYPDQFIAQNAMYAKRCVQLIYKLPFAFNMDPGSSPCLNHPPSWLTHADLYYKNVSISTTTAIKDKNNEMTKLEPSTQGSNSTTTKLTAEMAEREKETDKSGYPTAPETTPSTTSGKRGTKTEEGGGGEDPDDPVPVPYHGSRGAVMVSSLDGLRAYVNAHSRDCPELGGLLQDEQLRERLLKQQMVEVESRCQPGAIQTLTIHTPPPTTEVVDDGEREKESEGIEANELLPLKPADGAFEQEKKL